MTTLSVRLAEPVLAQATALAAERHLPVDEFVSRFIADQLQVLEGLAYLEERGRRGDRERFLAVLDKAPDVPPVPGDDLE